MSVAQVGRFFNKLKQLRGIATRYDKDPLNFLAAIKFAAARIWIKTLRVHGLALAPLRVLIIDKEFFQIVAGRQSLDEPFWSFAPSSPCLVRS